MTTKNAAKSININGLVDEVKGYQIVRELRWKEGVKCVWCDSPKVVKNGHTKETPECQKYCCQNCGRYFDDLTNTIFSGHHQPLSVWILCLYFMGFNLSNRQIAKDKIPKEVRKNFKEILDKEIIMISDLYVLNIFN